MHSSEGIGARFRIGDTILGHSMGTGVMLHFAHLYPEKALGLTSVDGAVNLDKGVISPFALLGFPPFRRAGEVLLTHHVTKERVGGILSSAYYRQDIMTAEVRGSYDSRLATGQWADSLLVMIRDASKNTITFALEDFQFPTLILWSQNDTCVKCPDIERWKDQVPSAEFHAIPEAGHPLMKENPDLFNNMVLPPFSSPIQNNSPRAIISRLRPF
jgi:pimeloyl-ACP methyl ester carboxylesterase